MRLSELFREVEFDGSIKNDADINLVTDDSRLVRPGSLFVCIRHRSFDGHTAALDALASGAAAVVTQNRLGLENELRVADSRSAYARLCAALCNHPERKLRMIGVTGTNGKTTVTTLIRNILSDSGTKTLLTGTVCNRLGDENLPSGLTTPKPPELYSLLSRRFAEVQSLRYGGFISGARAGETRGYRLRRGGVHKYHARPLGLSRHI